MDPWAVSQLPGSRGAGPPLMEGLPTETVPEPLNEQGWEGKSLEGGSI